MTRLHNGNPCQNILSAAKNVWERKVLANVDLKWPSSTGRYFQGKGNRKRFKKIAMMKSYSVPGMVLRSLRGPAYIFLAPNL